MFLDIKTQREIDNSINLMLMELGMSYPSNSLLKIAKALNLEMRISDSLPNVVRGVILRREGSKMRIVINRNNQHRNSFAIAHELGHFILHKNLFEKEENPYYIDKYDFTGENPEEQEAHYFAMSLLMPECLVKEILREDIPLKYIAEYFAVSLESVRLRVQFLKERYA